MGLFDGRGDVGKVLHPGSVVFDAAKKSYALTASGHNMWATEDGFHYVWKRASGDVSIAADIAWNNFGGNPHKKAVLVIRQSLDADSAYADAAAHGDGTFSLQGREEAGAATHEVQANAPRPTRLKLEKSGDYFYMSYAGEGETLKPSGGAVRVVLKDPAGSEVVNQELTTLAPDGLYQLEKATLGELSITAGDYNATLRKDDSPDMARTMAALDRGLRRAEQLARGLARADRRSASPRPPPSAESPAEGSPPAAPAPST